MDGFNDLTIAYSQLYFICYNLCLKVLLIWLPSFSRMLASFVLDLSDLMVHVFFSLSYSNKTFQF
jgi:hypothetical protein